MSGSILAGGRGREDGNPRQDSSIMDSKRRVLEEARFELSLFGRTRLSRFVGGATGTDQANTGGGFDRPNATGINPVLPRDQQTTEHFFVTDAYVKQPFGSFGNVGRNTLIGPRVLNWDLSAHKNFNFTERQYLQFRWEAFNAINHPNWSNPNVNRNSNAFGTIGGTRISMRQMQFALKYAF